jgi:hypothetical protein
LTDLERPDAVTVPDMPTVFDRGPYLALATFCDDVIQANDGTLSVIRIIDSITAVASGPAPPKDMPPFSVKTKLVVSFRTGEARARMTLAVRVEDPSGQRRPFGTPQSLTFPGPSHGAVNMIVEAQVGFDLEGLYWFDVLLDDHLVTRVALRAVYTPQPVQTS